LSPLGHHRKPLKLQQFTITSENNKVSKCQLMGANAKYPSPRHFQNFKCKINK